MAEGAKVLLNDGLSKGTADQEGSLDKLSEGTHVQVQLTVDRKRALSVRPLGKTYNGSLTAIDTANNSLTVKFKGDGGPVEKGLTIGKGAQVDSGAAVGSQVSVRTSVLDENIVVQVHVRDLETRDHQPDALRVEHRLLRVADRVRDLHEVRGEVAVEVRPLVDLGDRHDERVAGRERPDVEERNGSMITPEEPAWDLTGDDAREDGRHGERRRRRRIPVIYQSDPLFFDCAGPLPQVRS